MAADEVLAERSSRMCLERRSMSADTSGAGCQGKLTYPQCQLPQPNPPIHIHSLSSGPHGGSKDGRLEVIMKLLAGK